LAVVRRVARVQLGLGQLAGHPALPSILIFPFSLLLLLSTAHNSTSNRQEYF